MVLHIELASLLGCVWFRGELGWSHSIHCLVQERMDEAILENEYSLKIRDTLVPEKSRTSSSHLDGVRPVV